MLELTDGWYSIKAGIDRPLTSLVHRGRIKVGQKLIIFGAELIGSQDGSSPLEVQAEILFVRLIKSDTLSIRTCMVTLCVDFLLF